jgi:hypothetical protein
MSGSRWQGMETRQGDGTEALSQETESNGSATPKSRRHPLTLPADVAPVSFVTRLNPTDIVVISNFYSGVFRLIQTPNAPGVNRGNGLRRV